MIEKIKILFIDLIYVNQVNKSLEKKKLDIEAKNELIKDSWKYIDFLTEEEKRFLKGKGIVIKEMSIETSK